MVESQHLCSETVSNNNFFTWKSPVFLNISIPNKYIQVKKKKAISLNLFPPGAKHTVTFKIQEWAPAYVSGFLNSFFFLPWVGGHWPSFSQERYKSAMKKASLIMMSEQTFRCPATCSTIIHQTFYLHLRLCLKSKGCKELRGQFGAKSKIHCECGWDIVGKRIWSINKSVTCRICYRSVQLVWNICNMYFPGNKRAIKVVQCTRGIYT